MMVSALGIGRLTAGQDNAVIAVYTGTNATEDFEVLRSMVWGVLPMPSVFFLAAIIMFGAILRFTTFGRYVYAIGGNPEAAKLSGIKVAQVQLAAYLISGLLAGVAGVLFVAQYRQGKPDAGSGLELDAIAAVVIGGTSLMGGRGGLAGTFVGVLIFGLLSDILQLQNIDSNVQLLMKGLIIVGTVLVQEQKSRSAHGAVAESGADARAERGPDRPKPIGRVKPLWRQLQGRTSMKRREFLKLSATLAGATMTAYLPAGWTPAKAAAKWKVGFSQCTTLEPWRVQFNKDIEAEAKNHPEVDLIITDGQDKTEKQVADVENLIVQQVNVLLISPKELAGLTGVVDKAIDAKIPVIVLDRNVDTKRITQFIGGDNVLIGKAAGEYAVKLLGGPGKAEGNVVEIWGGMGTQPAHDRHDGFHAFTDKETGIKYLLNNQSGDWKQDKAYNIMTTALRNNEKIDLVYGHNDPMAYGAYLAAKDAGRDKDIKFILGIDGLPDEGVTWVHKGELTATFLYATPGAEGLRQAVKLLNGEKIPPVITLPTMLIDKDNAAEILKKNGLL